MTEASTDLNELLALRKAKLDALRGAGVAFPNQYKPKHFAADLTDEFTPQSREKLQEKSISVSMAGRIISCRMMGKASFIQIQDMSGCFQVYLRANDLPDGQYEAFKSYDLGDIVYVEGELFKTKTNELSLHGRKIVLLTKSLKPLPDKYHGLTDQEACYRQRYLDLIANPDSKHTFLLRSKLTQMIREFLVKRRFVEVETPMMHPIPGGAVARPFMTHHNALDMPLYLRIAPELYLKRLVVGGIDRVFEMNRNFRNEGVSTRHNPEFTMLEFYQAYADYHDLMDLTESLMAELAEGLVGSLQFTSQGIDYDFSKPFERISMKAAVLSHNPDLNEAMMQDLAALRAYLDMKGFHYEPHQGVGALQFILFEETVEETLLQPTFITAYPTEVSPLSRRNDLNPEISDRFEFFIAGREVANGFSELNDPEDQADRFQKQVEMKEAGDGEAMHYDSDYITALEYGLPPTAGEGIGIDRLAMLFADVASIRDVILFPLMRLK